MPTIEHTGGPGRFAHTALDHVSGHGDRHEVSESAAVHLCDDVGYFARVDEPDPDSEWEVGDDVHEEDGPPDVEEWHEWSEDSWLELDYQQRAADVREGRVDEQLNDIVDIETSDTVVEAVADRREQLED